MILKFLRHHINASPKISAFIAGILCAIAHAPLFFTPGLLGFSILLYVIYTASNYKEAIARNFAFGYGYFGGGLYWISIGITVYIDDFWWLIPICLLGMPLIFCIFTSFVAVFAQVFRNHKYYVLIYAIAWVFIEWLTSWIFTGLPWMLVGYSAGFSDALSQMASLCGVMGISFIFINLSGIFYYIWADGAKLLKYDIYYVLSVIAIMIIFGIVRLENNPTTFSDINVRIVQPSIPQNTKWDLDSFWKNLDLHKNLSAVNTSVQPDIILWSEAAVTAQVQIPVIRKYLNEVASATGAVLMTGALSEVDGKTYTSVNAINPAGKMLFDYHKRHLVPFGEYVPFKRFLPFKKLTAGFEDYAVGRGDVVISVPLNKGLLKIRPLICYESVFANEVRADDANLLINFTNNAWYGNSSGPYQHFYIGKFRAIENGIPLIIVANNGISGVIDSVGRVLSKTKINDIVALDCVAPKVIDVNMQQKSTISYIALILSIAAAYILRNFSIKP